MVGAARSEQSWVGELDRGLPFADGRVRVGVGSAAGCVRAVELAEQVERGQAHVRLPAVQAAVDEPAALGDLEPVGSVEQPVDHRITVARCERVGVAEQLLEPGRVGAQRASGRPPA